MTLAAIDLIAQAAPDYGAACHLSSGGTALLDLPQELVDGRVIPYRLLIEQTGDGVTAREETPQHLPTFCPERHINSDGTFCLFYPGADRLSVSDEDSARVWLETLWKFLKLQDRAERLKCWPDGETWAHGNAARCQLRAQQSATVLNNHLAKMLRAGKLTCTRRSSKHGPILNVWLGDLPLYSVWQEREQVINLKQRCFCRQSGLKLPKRLRRCRNHASAAVELALALHAWEIEEERFWKKIQGSPCCGRCNTCRLRDV